MAYSVDRPLPPGCLARVDRPAGLFTWQSGHLRLSWNEIFSREERPRTVTARSRQLRVSNRPVPIDDRPGASVLRIARRAYGIGVFRTVPGALLPAPEPFGERRPSPTHTGGSARGAHRPTPVSPTHRTVPLKRNPLMGGRASDVDAVGASATTEKAGPRLETEKARRCRATSAGRAAKIITPSLF